MMSYTLSILNIEFSCLYIASETVSMLLVQVWARLRSSLYVHDCLNGFLISIIVSYLVAEDKINHDMKAMAIFRATLKFVGMLNFNILCICRGSQVVRFCYKFKLLLFCRYSSIVEAWTLLSTNRPECFLRGGLLYDSHWLLYFLVYSPWNAIVEHVLCC